MTADKNAEHFLSSYDEHVFSLALQLREVIFTKLPNIIEQVDIPAKMVAYCYGQNYTELICTIMPSRKGLKLGFNRGTELPDPRGLLEGTGKISRYIVIDSPAQITSTAIKKLLENALRAYQGRMRAMQK